MGYNENQLTGGASFYREKGYANGTREGSYGYTTRNGLIRIVTYVADHNGYRAKLLTNEPGVGTANPANVNITKETEPDPAALAQGPTGSSAQSSTIPQQSSGNPQQSSGIPQQMSGIPQQSSGIPQQNYGVPQPSYASPQQSYGHPQQGSSYPQQSSSYPQQSSGIPQHNYGIPQQTYDGSPQQRSGIPQQMTGFPQQTYESSQQSDVNSRQYLQSSSVIYASGSDVIRNYVASPSSKSSAEVRIVSPYGQYQYVV